MSAFRSKTALYGIFHSVYEDDAGEKDSHIFSAVMHPGKRSIDAFVQDYSGLRHSVRTEGTRSKFNLAALVPIPAENARALTSAIDRINDLGERGVWPFYFSFNMSVLPEHEVPGQFAIAPEGQVHPAPKLQDVYSYTGTSETGLNRARINCVRMTMLAARLAGIKVPNIADINACFNTGEEVRDRIREAAAPYKMGRQRNVESRGTLPLFGQKNMAEGQVTGSVSGVSFVESYNLMTFNKFIDALSEKVEGRTMFDWLTKGKAKNFVTTPERFPAYLEAALKMTMSGKYEPPLASPVYAQDLAKAYNYP